MKKHIALILAIALCVSMLGIFTACKDEPKTEPEEAPISGGWTLNQALPESIEMVDGAKEALDLAADQLDGAIPVAYLGSQVVAGANYAYLCALSDDGTTAKGYEIVKIYKDLEGSATVLDATQIDLASYKTEATELTFPEAGLAGGWTVADASGAALDENAQAAFDAALLGFSGVGYTPLALLGTQVVAGTNYLVLCKATRVTAEPVSALAVVQIYAGLDGTAAITSVAGFDIP